MKFVRVVILQAGFGLFILVLGFLVWLAAGMQHLFLRLRLGKKELVIDHELVVWGIVTLVALSSYSFWRTAPEPKAKAPAPFTEEVSPRFAVGIREFEFTPRNLNVPPGAAVLWINHQGRHKIVADDDSFESPLLFPGDHYTHTFRLSGRYRYHCYFHGDVAGIGMAGVIHVTPSLP